MQFHEKKIDLFDFTSLFAWTFLNFLAHYAAGGKDCERIVKLKPKNDKMEIICLGVLLKPLSNI